MEKEKLQEVAFNIITRVGEARSIIFEALGNLGQKEITEKEFNELLNNASILLTDAGKEHMSVIQQEAEGFDIHHTLLLTHAEDLYLTTSTMLELVTRLIKVFKLK